MSEPSETLANDQKMAILSIALNILSMRILIILSLLLNTAVFVWALSQDSPSNHARLAGATIFAIANWCMVKLNPQETEHHGS
jgi:hypothetical protein